MRTDDVRGIGRSLSLVLLGALLGAVMLAPASATHKAKHTKKAIQGIKHRVVALEESQQCPAGTTSFAGGCIETAARAAQTWFEAAKTCAAAGGRLPVVDELFAYGEMPGVELAGDEQTGDIVGEATPGFDPATLDDAGDLRGDSNFAARQFRCFLPLPRPA